MRIAVTLSSDELEQMVREKLKATFPGYAASTLFYISQQTIYMEPELTPDEPLPFLKEAA